MSETARAELKHRSWNPLRGCTRISAGCQNCYAERFAFRLGGPGQPYEGLTVMTRSGPRWTGEIRLVPELLAEPYHWRKPSFIFVNSMSDVFHEDVPDEFIAEIFQTMMGCRRHMFFILTKRAARMKTWTHKWYKANGLAPLENVWLGASVEHQQAAAARVAQLCEVVASVKFLCCEPLLGELDLTGWLATGQIDWVIAGAESGLGARSMNEDWVRSLRDQCLSSEVLFCFKQNALQGRQLPYPELDGRRWQQQPPLPLSVIKAGQQKIISQIPKQPTHRQQKANPAQLAFDFED